MGTIEHVVLNFFFFFIAFIYAFVDVDITNNTKKLKQVIRHECLYLEEDMDRKKYFENGVLVKKIEDKVNNKIINNFTLLL